MTEERVTVVQCLRCGHTATLGRETEAPDRQLVTLGKVIQMT